ncbi:MAG TPA: trehalase-like domain-containing protein, partial [Arthrobacter sp.]|nr:trehalase-like domain-containing protein [Arthrobacter sp.]
MTSRPAGHTTGIPAEPSIGDHGLIGDMRTAALLDRWGRINWMCWPRFDSTPVFGSLLDPGRGGCWQ